MENSGTEEGGLRHIGMESKTLRVGVNPSWQGLTPLPPELPPSEQCLPAYTSQLESFSEEIKLSRENMIAIRGYLPSK